MSEVIVGCVPHVSKVHGGRFIASCGIDHFAEGRVFIAFPARLYHEVGEPSVEDGIKCVDVYLVETAGRFAVRFEKSVGVVRVAEDVNRGTVTGDELIFPVVELFRELGIKHEEQVGEGVFVQLTPLLVECRFGRGGRGSSVVSIEFLLDTVSLHGKEHHDGVMETHLPVSGEVLSGLDRVLARISGDFIKCRE